MALVSAVVNRSLRLLKVLDVRESPAAEDSQTAIAVLNAMCARWEASGLALGWAAVSAPDGTLPAPDEAHEALAYNLAVKLAPEYGAQMDPDDKAEARRLLNELRRDRLVEMPVKQQSRLACLGSTYNTVTDSYD